MLKNLSNKIKTFFKINERENIKDVLEDLIEDNGNGQEKIDDGTKNIFKNVINLNNKCIEDVMIPRADIDAVSLETTYADLVSFIDKTKHSRIPVFDDNLDQIQGMVHIRDLFEKIIAEINKDATTATPYYFSDLFAHGAYVLTEHKVINADNPFYQLNTNFDLTTLSSKSVLVYLNGDLLIHGKDYNFDNQGFVAVTKTIALDDIIAVYEYETTDGCHVPETPTKFVGITRKNRVS